MPSLSAVFPRNVRAERVRRGWDQVELGKRLGGWPASRVSDFEVGRTKLSGDHLAQFCRALELPLITLAQGVDADDLRALGI